MARTPLKQPRKPVTQARNGVVAWSPIDRARILSRLAAAAEHSITLIVAPAGYGKSVALRQYVATLTERVVAFSLRPEHATLLGFLRGFTDALAENAPHASLALAGAYDGNIAPNKRAGELAAWLHAHLESFSGLIVVDDLHVAEDVEVAQFLTALIERTKHDIRWILASRSSAGLPVATWVAYRDADLPLDESDLRFTNDETRAAACQLGLCTAEHELDALLRLTEGWPAAIGFALRTSIRSAELGNITALTREMVYRLLAEQVYAGLDAEERDLLELASALPAIDVKVLARAGIDRALTIVERLRERTSFIYETSPGVYECHDLFREFLRRQTSLQGKRSEQSVHERAARALEAGGDFEHAIAAFVAAGAPADVVRLLTQHGFDLLERAQGDVISRALESLEEKLRRENATLLALQGALHAAAGRFSRAESIFRAALRRAGDDRELVAIVSLRLASLMANQGQDVTKLLGVVADDVEQSVAYRAEALSLVAAQRAVAADRENAKLALERVEPLTSKIDSDATRARVLHRVGIAFHNLELEAKAVESLVQSSELASELHFYAIASRANAVLSNLALHENDDVSSQLRYAELSTAAAMKAGDTFALQTAQLQTLSAWMRRGDIPKIIEMEQQLLVSGRDSALVMRFLTLFRSLRLAWDGRFSEAHCLLATCWAQLTFDFDRIVAGSEYALFLALDEQQEASGAIAKEILSLIESSRATGLFRTRSLAIAKALCALAESINGRPTRANRILRRGNGNGDQVIGLAVRIIDTMVSRLRNPNVSRAVDIQREIHDLAKLGYGDIANLLTAVEGTLGRQAARRADGAGLTKAEVDVLRFLAEGFNPKEIAGRTGRSVYTVRVHIANAVTKLGCHGGLEAVRAAQHRGVI